MEAEGSRNVYVWRSRGLEACRHGGTEAWSKSGGLETCLRQGGFGFLPLRRFLGRAIKACAVAGSGNPRLRERGPRGSSWVWV